MTPTSVSHFFCGSVCRTPYLSLRYHTSSDHNFWLYTGVKWRYLHEFFFIYFFKSAISQEQYSTIKIWPSLTYLLTKWMHCFSKTKAAHQTCIFQFFLVLMWLAPSQWDLLSTYPWWEQMTLHTHVVSKFLGSSSWRIWIFLLPLFVIRGSIRSCIKYFSLRVFVSKVSLP